MQKEALNFFGLDKFFQSLSKKTVPDRIQKPVPGQRLPGMGGPGTAFDFTMSPEEMNIQRNLQKLQARNMRRRRRIGLL